MYYISSLFNAFRHIHEQAQAFDHDEEESPEPYETESEESSDEINYLIPYFKYAHHFTQGISKEPILEASNARYSVYPIQYMTIWDNYKMQLKLNWVVEEIDLAKDLSDWDKKLDDNDRHFLMHVLAFFASADGIVNANIKKNLIDVITIKEAECAYGKQFEMENAHGEMYSLMIKTFIKDSATQNKCFRAIEEMPAIRRKAKWCKRWIDSDFTYAHKLFAFVIVEAVFFSGSFAAIFWLKTRPGNVMPGLRKSNKFIARDEDTHVDLAIKLYGLLQNRLKQRIVHDMMREAVLIENEFINVSLPCRLLGMNAELMLQYIQYVADYLLCDLGYDKLYNVTNPFDFVEKNDYNSRDNIFEQNGDAYTDPNIDNPRIFEILQNGF